MNVFIALKGTHFYFCLNSHTFTVGIQKTVCPKKTRENDKIQLSPPVTPSGLNTYFLPICYSDALIPNIFTFMENITSKCTQF